MDDGPIHLSAWIKDERARLDAFAASWRKTNATEPEHFPMEMPPGEWDEQYRSWGGA